MKTSLLCAELKRIYGRKFRADELNNYAKQLGMKTYNNASGAAVHYKWSPEDIERVKMLIEKEL